MVAQRAHTTAASDTSLGRVILVEDSDEVRHSLTLLLRTRGFSVEAYRTAVELLSAKFLLDPDCFLIDFKMPVVDGVELLKKLRANGLKAPAIMLTGFLTTHLTDTALRAGFEEVIEKPPKFAALINRVSSITQRD